MAVVVVGVAVVVVGVAVVVKSGAIAGFDFAKGKKSPPKALTAIVTTNPFG